jgi:hypothetical protein
MITFNEVQEEGLQVPVTIGGKVVPFRCAVILRPAACPNWVELFLRPIPTGTYKPFWIKVPAAASVYQGIGGVEYPLVTVWADPSMAVAKPGKSVPGLWTPDMLKKTTRGRKAAPKRK